MNRPVFKSIIGPSYNAERSIPKDTYQRKTQAMEAPSYLYRTAAHSNMKLRTMKKQKIQHSLHSQRNLHAKLESKELPVYSSDKSISLPKEHCGDRNQRCSFS